MPTDQLTATFSALADPTRRAILARLVDGDATVGELAEPHDISGPAISRHLKVLEKAGLISRGRNAQWRPCHLETEPLQVADSWMDRYRGVWNASWDQLDEHLRNVQAKAGTDKDPE